MDRSVIFVKFDYSLLGVNIDKFLSVRCAVVGADGSSKRSGLIGSSWRMGSMNEMITMLPDCSGSGNWLDVPTEGI